MKYIKMKYIKKHIEIRKSAIEKELKHYKSAKKEQDDLNKKLEDTRWGNRILGHLESLEFCLKQINELLKLKALKELDN